MAFLRQALAAVAMLVAPLVTERAGADEPRRLACLSNAESREAMQGKKVILPFRAVAAALREGGDLMTIRLCRLTETTLVYDVAVLRLDGRLVHVEVDAVTGDLTPARR